MESNYYDIVLKTMSERIQKLETQLESHKPLWGGTEYNELAERYKALEAEYYNMRDMLQQAVSLNSWLIIKITETKSLFTSMFPAECFSLHDYNRIQDALDTISDVLVSYKNQEEKTEAED